MTTPKFVQQAGQPLFPAVLYSRPITRQAAGRLLLVGGHIGELSLPTGIHRLALAAGVGECTVVLPSVLAKLLSGASGTAFADSTPSGSLARGALGRILELSEEADAVGIGASLSSNSDTAMLTERLAGEIERPLILFEDALVALSHHPELFSRQPRGLIIATMAEVFKLCGLLSIPVQIRRDAGLINKLEIISNLYAALDCDLAVYGTEIITMASDTAVVTPIDFRLATQPAIFYATLSTFWLQNPRDRHAGLATGAFVIKEATADHTSSATYTLTSLANNLDSVLRRDEF